jgi:hypothetical protein
VIAELQKKAFRVGLYCVAGTGVVCALAMVGYFVWRSERAEARANHEAVEHAGCREAKRGLEMYIGQRDACSREVKALHYEMQTIGRGVKALKSARAR